jgi:hypothetical protein
MVQRSISSIAEVKQRSQRSVVGWVTKNLLSRAPPCFGWHVNQLFPAAFVIVPITIPRRVNVRQAAGRKMYLPNLYHNMMKNMLY